MSLFNNKKLKELQSENEELRKAIDGLSEKENQLKNFDDMVKKARLEYAEVSSKKDQTAQKLESLEKEKTKLLSELNKISTEIKQLREIKLSEQNQIVSLNSSSDNASQSINLNPDILSKEIEEAEKRKNDIALETFKLKKGFEETKLKIGDSKRILSNLNSEIEKKKEEISSLIERQMLISDDQYKNLSLSFGNKNIDEIHLRLDKLIRQEKELTEMVNSRKQLLSELDRRISEKKVIANTNLTTKQTGNTNPNEEFTKRQQISNLEIQIESMEAQLAQLTNELNSKTELFNELQSDIKQLSENLQSGKAELVKLNESIEIATAEITDLDHSLNVLDKEFKKISKEVSQKMELKENLETEIAEMNEEKINLDDLLNELKETTTILSRLKNDIERGTGQSAKRFTGVIQYYSTVINDIYKKKKDADKILNQREKEIKEKEDAINDMKNVLLVRHNKIKLFEDLTRQIINQRNYFKEIRIDSDHSKSTDNLILSKDVPQKKLIEYENALMELLNSSDKYFGNLLSSKISLEKEISENKNRLNELNQNIRQSTGELSELRDSISKIKVEHEEHRLSINKLTFAKTKLETHIENHKKIIEKYISIKDKIREEQELIKKKREHSLTTKTSGQATSGGKTFEPNNPNWIKL